MSYSDGMRIFDSDLNKFLETSEGNGVIVGLEVTEHEVGQNSSVDVSSGAAIVNGSLYELSSSSNVVLTNADASNPRKDIIIINSSGTLTKVDGSAEAAQPSGQTGTDTYRPKPADIPSNAIILAEVWRATNDNTVADADITDRRVFIRMMTGDADYTIIKGTNEYYAFNKYGILKYGGPTDMGGATGTNAATVINNAFGALTAGRSWKEAVKLKGAFSLTGQITPATDSILDLTEARLDVDGNVHAVYCSSKDRVIILGGVIDGNKDSRSGDLAGLYLTGCSHVTVDGTRILETRKYGVYSYNSTHSTFKNSFLYRVGDNAITAIYGIVLTGTAGNNHHNNVLNNYVEQNGDTGGYMVFVGESGEYVKICENTLKNGFDRVDKYECPINCQGSHCVIANNIVMDMPTHAGIDVGHGDHNTVVGNYVENCGDAGYRGGIHLVDGRQTVVCGNTVYNCVRGITISDKAENPPVTYDCIVTGNNIDGGARGQYGIYGNCLRCAVSDNHVKHVKAGSGWGIVFNNITAQQNSFNMVHNNWIEDCNVGIYENNHAYLSIQGNVVKNCTTYMTLEDDGGHHVLADNVDWHA